MWYNESWWKTKSIVNMMVIYWCGNMNEYRMNMKHSGSYIMMRYLFLLWWILLFGPPKTSAAASASVAASSSSSSCPAKSATSSSSCSWRCRQSIQAMATTTVTVPVHIFYHIRYNSHSQLMNRHCRNAVHHLLRAIRVPSNRIWFMSIWKAKALVGSTTTQKE